MGPVKLFSFRKMKLGSPTTRHELMNGKVCQIAYRTLE